MRFGSKEVYDNYVFTKKSKLTTFVSGACAGSTEALFVVTPQETVKTKLIHDRLKETPKYKGLFHGMRSIYAAEGAAGLYRGPFWTILRQGSN